MAISIRKVWIFTVRAFLALAVFFCLYTIYSVFANWNLCDLTKKNPKTTAFIEQKKEEWQDEKVKRKIDQRWVPLSSISRHLKNAVIVTEDPNFYSHHGLDFEAIRIAFRENVERGEIFRGASTITQQLMKNLYLSPSQNPLRKWREAILALRVERCLSKNRILEIYLNVIEWGESVYGIEAASRRYFGKSSSSLNPAESALLAAMIRNPVLYNPYRWNSRLMKNKNQTLRNMWKSGKLSRGDYESAIHQTIRLRR
jgi:monofunctional biosynthetic peptidoglycan transglycosylase